MLGWCWGSTRKSAPVLSCLYPIICTTCDANRSPLQIAPQYYTLVLHPGSTPWYYTLVPHPGTTALVTHLSTALWHYTLVLYPGTIPWHYTLVWYYTHRHRRLLEEPFPCLRLGQHFRVPGRRAVGRRRRGREQWLPVPLLCLHLGGVAHEVAERWLVLPRGRAGVNPHSVCDGGGEGARAR